jgi:hypothetical protein
MFVRLITICLISVGLECTAQTAPRTENFPWAPEIRCKLNPPKPQGLHPEAYSALQSLALSHRITQGINHSSDRGNVHDTDGTINGNAYTGAVDISVRCLTEAQIKTLLGRLATLGFAAWYRRDGRDGWTGPPHIHGIWAGCRLKPVLREQVENWLGGTNGLSSNQPYQFWQPSAAMKEKVRTLYRTFN